MRRIFVQVWRVLRDDGVLFLNFGDSYAGSGKAGSNPEYQGRHTQFGQKERKERLGMPVKPTGGLKNKDLVMMPARVAMALQADGWYLRSIAPWVKRNATPESTKDRPTTSNEWIMMFTKSGKPLFWTHPRKRGTRRKPEPDYVYVHRLTGEEVAYQPVSDRILPKFWKRKNLWRSHHYYYDIDAVRLPHKTSDNRNISLRAAAYRGKFDKSMCEMVSSPRARQLRPGYTPSYYHPVGRNRRTGDWWYETLERLAWDTAVYLDHINNIRKRGGMMINENGIIVGFNVNTKPFKRAHFAVFPEELIEPCILVSTSPKVCGQCGVPYARQTSRKVKSKSRSKSLRGFDSLASNLSPRVPSNWVPTCDCTPVDGSGCSLLLDPFVGSGTTGVVAVRFGRDYVGIDISEEYAQISRERIAQEAQKTSGEGRSREQAENNSNTPQLSLF